ncbi:hypothetical protein [Desulfuribacillus alkaliarsenatis]|uniref:hypothetical protein n=1 Tax=Desulfuribacillus alkaliarsenatis TaxID=766136 RepID=UPI0009FCDC3D|nr:hypothetical protein [Desulfuribacillus alkaliarsenatis]
MTDNKHAQEHLTSTKYGTRGAPWGWQESLQSKTQEVGVDFDHFIECLRLQMDDEKMAEVFHVPEKTIFHLRNHFEKYGIDSMVGWD